MLTRRTFFGTLAALAVGARVAPEPVTGYIFSLGGRPLANPFPIYGGTAGAGKSMMVAKEGAMWRYEQKPDGFYGWTRRDDGDTILELR